MPSSWLMNLASFAKGRIKRSSQKQITYTYTVDTSRKPRRLSSRSRLPTSSSPGGTSSSRDSSSGSDSARLPNEIRPGYVVVSVGSERKRFIISTSILGHPLFMLVLEKLDSSHVLDVDHRFRDDDETGGILLSCNTEFLHRLLFLIDSGGDHNQEMRWDELKKYLEGDSDCRNCGSQQLMIESAQRSFTSPAQNF